MLPTEKLMHQALVLRELIAFVKTTPCSCIPSLDGDVEVVAPKLCRRCELLETSKPFAQLSHLFAPEPPPVINPCIMDHP